MMTTTHETAARPGQVDRAVSEIVADLDLRGGVVYLPERRFLRAVRELRARYGDKTVFFQLALVAVRLLRRGQDLAAGQLMTLALLGLAAEDVGDVVSTAGLDEEARARLAEAVVDANPNIPGLQAPAARPVRPALRTRGAASASGSRPRAHEATQVSRPQPSRGGSEDATRRERTTDVRGRFSDDDE